MSELTHDAALLPPRAPLPPALPTWNPLGHFFAFRKDAPALFLRAAEAGDAVRLRVGDRHILALSHPDGVQHVLVTKASRYVKRTRGYESLRALLGDGLLTSEGEVWKRERRIIQPAFQQARYAGFARTMAVATLSMAERWDQLAETGETFDAAAAMSELTLRIAGETFFSQDVSQRTGEVAQALDTVLSGFIRGVLNPLAARLPLPATFRHRRAIRTLDAVVRGIVAKRRAEGGGGDDLLGMLMAARDQQTGEAMSDEQLRDEILTMLLAGHETTANALAWTLYRLSQHEDADARLHQELMALPEGPMGQETLQGLSWLDLVLKESLRLHPPAWVESRLALDDDEILGYRVPKGTFVFLSQYAVHRNPRLWEDPHRFDPERFLPARQVCPDGSARPRLAFFPFGAGARKCIGESFALLEAKIVLAILARRFRLRLAPGHRVEHEPTVTLRPRGGLPMRVERR